jgi:hypothetical protein
MIMKKYYAAPRLTLKGEIVESTRSSVLGTGDPADPFNLGRMLSDSVGFSL